MRWSRRDPRPITSAGNLLQIAPPVDRIWAMKIRLMVVGLAVVVALIRVGMHSSSSTSRSGGGGGSSASDEAPVDPATMAKEVDKFAAEELKGKKLDVKQWLVGNNHGTFKAKKADVVKLTNDCLAAGAVGVWCSEPESVENNSLIDHIFVELPADPAKRAKVFAVY